MTIRVKKGPGGKTKVLGGASQINPIAREPHDNTRDLELAEFKAKQKRKFPAPDASSPGIKRTTRPAAETGLPG